MQGIAGKSEDGGGEDRLDRYRFVFEPNPAAVIILQVVSERDKGVSGAGGFFEPDLQRGKFCCPLYVL